MKRKFIEWLKKNLFLLIFSITLISGSLIYYSKNGITRDNFYFLMFLYMGIFSFAGLLPQNKIFDIIKTIIYIPFILLMLIKPFVGFIFALLFGIYTPLAAISLLFIHLPEKVFNIDLLLSTKLYLILTIWTIIISLFGEFLMKQAILIQEYDKSETKRNSQIEFNQSLINNGIIKYILFFTYFIVLIIFSVIKLNHYQVFENNDIYLSINLSFVTFLAFDRLITNKKLFNLIPNNIFLNLMKVWKTHLIDDIESDIKRIEKPTKGKEKENKNMNG